MEKQEAKRHHYIPQFILRNFNNENGQVMYYDISTKVLEPRNTRSIFMNMHMYRDEINHEDNPTYIESSLSKFEQEIAELFRDKFIDKEEITLTRRELEKLRIFLGLLSFRTDHRANQYINNTFDDMTRNTLSSYAKDGNYADLWKREIEEISKMRTFDEFEKSKTIDPIIKMDFHQLLQGFYMTVVDARGGDFLMTDVYPTLEVFPLINGTNIHMHFFYPISPNRMIVLNHIMFKKENTMLNSDSLIGPMKKMSQIRGLLLKQPKNKYVSPGFMNMDDKYIYRPQKIYAKDLTYINSLFLNEARIGIMFKDKNRIVDSIKCFDNESNTKQRFTELEMLISKWRGKYERVF